jgi:hypothetical protein
MKIRDVNITPEELLKKLDEAKKSWASDPDLYNYLTGTEEEPAVSVIRPVGAFENAKMHYLKDFVGEGEDTPRVLVCIGLPHCPVCKLVKNLYAIGTQEAKDQASGLRGVIRNYWPIIPRGTAKGAELIPYDWKDSEPRCLVLPFGIMVERLVEKIVADTGHPGDIEQGFDLDFTVFKQKSNGFNKYELKARENKRKSKTGWVSEVTFEPLTEDELGYDIPDLEKYLKPPTEEDIMKVAKLFQIEMRPAPGNKRRTDVGAGKVEEEKAEEQTDPEEVPFTVEGQPFCFADADTFDVDSKICKNCESRIECSREVKKALGAEELKKGKTHGAGTKF